MDEKLVFQREGGMFSNEPVYLASFEVELLVYVVHEKDLSIKVPDHVIKACGGVKVQLHSFLTLEI